MAERHIADKEAEFVAVNGPPDMCRVGKAIIPFDITDTLDKARDPSANVYARSQNVLTQTTRVNTVVGDAGSGLVSGVSRGHSIVLQGSSTVFVNGKPCARHGDPVGKTAEEAAAVNEQVQLLVTDTAQHEQAAMQSAMKGRGDMSAWNEASMLKTDARNMVAEAERQVAYANPNSKVAREVVGAVAPGSGVVDAGRDAGAAWSEAKAGNFGSAAGHAAMAVVGIVTEAPGFKQVKGLLKIGKAVDSAKDASKAADATKEASKAADAAGDAKKASADNPAAGGGGNGVVIKKKAKRKPRRRCELVPYDELECEPGQEAHHVVPDWMLRLGKRGGGERVPDMPSLASGPAICLESGGGNEHNTAHKHTDRPAQRVAKNGYGGSLPGTIQLGQAKVISARAIEKATGGKKGGGCDRDDIKKQLDENFTARDETLLRGVKDAKRVSQTIKDALSGGKD